MPQKRYMGLTQIDLIIQIYYFLCGFCDFCEILFFLSQTAQTAQKGIWVSHRLIWLFRFYYFLLRFPRFLRETPLPLADSADGAENLYNRINLCEPITHPGLRLPCSITQIDMIKQILLFSSAVSAISARNYQSSRRRRRRRRKVYGSHTDWFD